MDNVIIAAHGSGVVCHHIHIGYIDLESNLTKLWSDSKHTITDAAVIACVKHNHFKGCSVLVPYAVAIGIRPACFIKKLCRLVGVIGVCGNVNIAVWLWLAEKSIGRCHCTLKNIVRNGIFVNCIFNGKTHIFIIKRSLWHIKSDVICKRRLII